jgi:hypothetical protein
MLQIFCDKYTKMGHVSACDELREVEQPRKDLAPQAQIEVIERPHGCISNKYRIC